VNTSLRPAEPPQAFPVFDGHVDLVYAMMERGDETPFAGLAAGPVTASSLAEGNVRTLVCALYCADAHNGPGTALEHLRSLQGFAERRLSGLQRIHGEAELEASFRGESQTGVLFLVENGDALLEADLDALRSWGVTAVGLTHAGRNRIADGNGVVSPGGLSAAGRRLVGELERRGWVIDVAHLAAPGFREVAEIFGGPLVCSHTGLRPFCDRPRNLDEAQVRLVLDRGGVVGLALAPEMLSITGRAGIEDLFRQVDWLVQKVGPDGVGLGTDLGGFDGACRGLEDHGRLGLLAERMLGAGYGREAVAGIMGGNWYRFYSGLLAGGTEIPG